MKNLTTVDKKERKFPSSCAAQGKKTNFRLEATVM